MKIRYCDLQSLAARAALEILQDSPAFTAVKQVTILRDKILSGAVKPDGASGLLITIAAGEPEVRNRALAPAPEAAVLQVILASCEAIRRAEQLAITLDLATDADGMDLDAVLSENPDKAKLLLNPDVTSEGLKYAIAFTDRHPELPDEFGFDLHSAAAAWYNLAVYAGSLPDTGLAETAYDVVEEIRAGRVMLAAIGSPPVGNRNERIRLQKRESS